MTTTTTRENYLYEIAKNFIKCSKEKKEEFYQVFFKTFPFESGPIFFQQVPTGIATPFKGPIRITSSQTLNNYWILNNGTFTDKAPKFYYYDGLQ